MIRRILYLAFCIGLLGVPASIVAQLTGTPLGTAGGAGGATGATGAAGAAGSSPADATPTSPNALDDEFKAASLDAQWTWVNQETATVTAALTGPLILHVPASGGVDVRVLKEAAPVAPWTVVLKLDAGFPLANYSGAGLCFRNTNEKLLTYGPGYNATVSSENGALTVQRYTTPNVWASNLTVKAIPFGAARYLKAASDGTTLVLSFSTNGSVFHPFASETIAGFLGTIDEIGIFAFEETGGGVAYDVAFEHFRVL